MACSLGWRGGGHKLRSGVLPCVLLFVTLWLSGMATTGAAPSVTAAVQEPCSTDVLLQEIANSLREMANSSREIANSLQEMANSSQEIARASKSIDDKLSSFLSWIKVALAIVGNLIIEVMKIFIGYYTDIRVQKVVDQRREARSPRNDLEVVSGQTVSRNQMAVSQSQLVRMLERVADTNRQVLDLQAQLDRMSKWVADTNRQVLNLQAQLDRAQLMATATAEATKKEEANRKDDWVQECLGDRQHLKNHNLSILPKIDDSLNVTTDYALKKAALKKAAGYLTD